MSLENAGLFTSAVDTDKRRDEADSVVSSTIRNKYGRSAILGVPKTGHSAWAK